MYRHFSFLKITPFLLMSGILFMVPLGNGYAQAGCCSGHGGIDRCDTKTNFFVCKDKSPSPTCKCDGTTSTKEAVAKPKEAKKESSKAMESKSATKSTSKKADKKATPATDKKAVKEKKAADKKSDTSKKAASDNKTNKKSEVKKTQTKTKKAADDKKQAQQN
jgi:hypothetical protein